MNDPLKSIEGTGIAAAMADLGRRAMAPRGRLRSRRRRSATQALAAMAQAIRDNEGAILAANAEDVAEAKADGTTRRSSIASRSTPNASPRWRTASRSCAISPTRSVPSWKAGPGRTA